MLNGLGGPSALAVAERQGSALEARFAARRDNAAEIARFRQDAPRIADAEALLKDRRALRLVLEAFQLESEIDKRAMLRRALTEDPADPKSMANRMADPRWRQLAQAFAARQAVALTPDQIASQTTEQLRAMTLARMAGLAPAQVAALTPGQVGALDPAQIAAISPDSVIGLGGTAITALDGAQAAALTPAQLRALAPAQVAAIEPADLATLGEAQLRAFTPVQLQALSGAQMQALTPTQLGAFSAAQAAAFSSAQRDALSPSARAVLAAAPARPDEEPAATKRPLLADRALVDRIVQGAMTNRYEKAMGEANPGLREALYFRRMAASVQSIPQLMGDRALLTVVRGALNLPKQFGALEYEQQRDLLTRRLDVKQLQDPKFVARMAQRYVAQLEPAQATGPLATLFGGGSANGILAYVGQRVSYRA